MTRHERREAMYPRRRRKSGWSSTWRERAIAVAEFAVFALLVLESLALLVMLAPQTP